MRNWNPNITQWPCFKGIFLFPKTQHHRFFGPYVWQAARAFCQLAALDTEGATGHTVLGALRQQGKRPRDFFGRLMRVNKRPENRKKNMYPPEV